jgi:23S rRNA (uracil1939-C5)-methyltransferase
MLTIGELYTFDILGLTKDGCGIGMVGDIKVFIEGAIPGEKVQGIITKIEPGYAAAKLYEIIVSKGDRINPFCHYFYQCGGCSLQFIPYDQQLVVKRDMVKEAVDRIAGLDTDIVKETIGSKDMLHYRNKAQYPVEYSDGEYKIGFYKSRSKQVIDLNLCSLQHTYSNSVKEAVRIYLEELEQSEKIIENKVSILRHIVTRVSHSTGDVMAILVTPINELPETKKLIEIIIKRVPAVKSIYVNHNPKETNQIMGEESRLIFGKEKIVDSIGPFNFVISPLSFFQVNPGQTEVLYDKVRDFANLTGKETILDLYCGTGTISIYLSGNAKEVIGIEGVEEAVKNAETNMDINRVKNAKFIYGRVEHVVEEINEGVDVVIVDPPRKGCKKEVLEALINIRPARIVYVSCNPSTMAADVKYLTQNGYGVRVIQPVDMFPHTAHVETVVLLYHKNADVLLV